jgi:hypothetical protein
MDVQSDVRESMVAAVVHFVCTERSQLLMCLNLRERSINLSWTRVYGSDAYCSTGAAISPLSCMPNMTSPTITRIIKLKKILQRGYHVSVTQPTMFSIDLCAYDFHRTKNMP